MDSGVRTALISTFVSAVVAVFVALLTPWVKNRFDKQARAEEWAQKREDWLLEKRARDAEEVVTALERVLKGLSYTLNIVSNEVFSVANYARDRRGIVSDVIQEKFQRLGLDLAQVRTKHTNWFLYDTRRLTIWFVEDERVYKELQDLGERVISMYEGLGIQLGTVSLRWDERNEWANPGEYLRAVDSDSKDFREKLERYRVLVDDIIRFQRELIKSLGEPQGEQVVAVNKGSGVTETSPDSLTVEVVRGLERRLRGGR